MTADPSPQSGFTLTELLVVIMVFGVLATLVAPTVFRHITVAKETTARSQIEMLGAPRRPTVSTAAATHSLGGS